MRRRELIAGFIVASLAERAARAADKPFRVGITFLVNDESSPQFVAFEQRMRQLINGSDRELVIDFTALDGDAARYPAAMRELTSRKPDVIVAPGPEVSLKAALAVTQTIPIVMIGVDYDPLTQGYVRSLAHPGGNITGVYLNTVDIAAKRAEILKEAVPDAKRFIVFWDAAGKDSFEATQPALKALGIEMAPVELRNPPYDYEAALLGASPHPGDALLCMLSPYFFHDLAQLDALAVQHKLPSMCGGVDSGGLVAFSASLEAMFRKAADYVDKIRRGAKPDEMPIERPTRFKLVVDLRFAKQIGVTIPPSILARADEVIE